MRRAREEGESARVEWAFRAPRGFRIDRAIARLRGVELGPWRARGARKRALAWSASSDGGEKWTEVETSTYAPEGLVQPYGLERELRLRVELGAGERAWLFPEPAAPLDGDGGGVGEAESVSCGFSVTLVLVADNGNA